MAINELGYARRGNLALLISCIALFHFGWFKFFGHGQLVYVMDWVLRVAILALAWESLKREFRPWYPVARPRDWVIGVFLMYLIVKYNGDFVSIFFFIVFSAQEFRYFAFPILEPSVFWLFDLLFGLFLVGLTEEFVYRKLFVDLWREKKWPTWALYLISSSFFGLLHANQGNLRFFETFIWGLFLMWMYRRSNSLAFVIMLHWFANILSNTADKFPYYTLQSDFWCGLALKCVQKEIFYTWPLEYQIHGLPLGNAG